MSLHELHINNLRIINAARLTLHPAVNLIIGPNGSGKTSFLEAIYLLGTGHSFRTRETSALIAQNQESLTVFATARGGHRVSIQKSLHGPTTGRLNGKPCLTSSQLAAFLPCQVFYQDIFQLIDGGPALRRSVLDWGMFHVKHDYLNLWKDYRRALKQRNSLLKQKASPQILAPWNKTLTQLAEPINEWRQNYFQSLKALFSVVLADLTSIACSLQYYKGWDKKNEGKNLEEILANNYEKDILYQLTHYGPHQADLIIDNSHIGKAKLFFSRGEQKIILFALKFAQAKLLLKPCIYLIDDLTTELDHFHIQRLLQFIASQEGQFFITFRTGDAVLQDFTLTGNRFLLEKGKIEVLP